MKKIRECMITVKQNKKITTIIKFNLFFKKTIKKQEEQKVK